MLYLICLDICYYMQDIDILIDDYLIKLSKSYGDFDKNKDIIKKACDVAKLAHELQFRKYSGEPYITHPLNVSIMIAEKCDNLVLILAWILHDTVEDSPEKVSMEFIYNEFGQEVGYLVDSVTDNILFYHNEVSVEFKDKLDKLLTWAIKDARCVFLKLIDRQHNNQTLAWLKTDKQIRKSFETQALYNPLRKILRVDEWNFVLKEMCALLASYMKSNNIVNADQLKSNLYNITFHDIDSENFELFYYASDSIVWEIVDKKLLQDLMTHECFDDKIDVISIKQDSLDNFSCLFKYKEGQVFDNDIKMKISSFKY